MIGCPVGSIHRGENKQMVIENWCIGCELCARNCPYGSIQMHDIGVIPEGSAPWRYWPATAGEAWTRPAYRDGNWLLGAAPFVSYDRDFQARLAEARQPGPAAGADPAICFRLEFQLDRGLLGEARLFEMKLTSMDETAAVWINGHKIETEEKAKRDGSRLYRIAPGQKVLRAGRNVLAVRVVPKAGEVKTVLDVRLDEQRAPVVPLGLTPEELSEKVVTEVAVVCDMCSQQFGQRPACVNACPHDAAVRVDARFEFPVR
jgi:Fe-S-cluster-containing hydrogenase component 2